MGSYSFLPVRSFNENPVHWHHLQAPVTPPYNNMNPYEQYNFQMPTLYWAGEAYDERYGGMLQGAYESGWKTAIEIIKSFGSQ